MRERGFSNLIRAFRARVVHTWVRGFDTAWTYAPRCPQTRTAQTTTTNGTNAKKSTAMSSQKTRRGKRFGPSSIGSLLEDSMSMPRSGMKSNQMNCLIITRVTCDRQLPQTSCSNIQVTTRFNFVPSTITPFPVLGRYPVFATAIDNSLYSTYNALKHVGLDVGTCV